MRAGSLFSGIGGMDLGLQRAGFEIAWQVEINQFARAVLEKHWPQVPRFEDVKTVGSHNLSPVDIVAGGPPCQPHSVAGKRKGAADDRDLWPEMRRVISELRPRWVLVENVPGIRTTILDGVLSDLENLDYSTGTLVVPACALGAPHIRQRVFVIAHTDRYRRVREGVSDVHEPGGEESSCPHTGWLREALSDADRLGRDGRQSLQEAAEAAWLHAVEGENPWAIEPGVGRVAYGIPDRVDRVKALGNAVVPQIVEYIGRLIIIIDRRCR